MAKPAWVYLVAAARKIWRWSPKRSQLKREAKKCVSCSKPFKTQKDVQADHITPVGKAPREWKGWDEYYERLFEGELQPLCVKCHKEKSAKERKEMKNGKARKDDI